jgi:hypothetical protein
VAKASPWIGTPFVDLFFFSFGWVTVLIAYLLVDASIHREVGRTWILNVVLLVAVFHRHLTFPLVYADGEQFQARRPWYVWLPVFFTLVTLLGYFHIRPASLETGAVRIPVEVAAGDSVVIRTAGTYGPQEIPVRFRGTEATLPELAATFQGALGDAIHVEAEGDGLTFTSNGVERAYRFSVLEDRSSPALLARLGLTPSEVTSRVASKPLLTALILLSLLWNFYHTIMQKIGLLRIYSRKAGYGLPWLDKSILWVWFVFVFFQLGSMPSTVSLVGNLTSSGRALVDALKPFMALFSVLAKVSLAAASVITALYLREEWRHRHRLHWPKTLLLSSVLMLYALFFYDFFVAYVVFGFSHAIEYLAFVNIFARKKFLARPAGSSLMARLVRSQGLAMGVFIGVSSLVFIPWYFLSNQTLGAFILATSFLHFLYDGWIWKVRKPTVGQPLGLEYRSDTMLEPA